MALLDASFVENLVKNGAESGLLDFKAVQYDLGDLKSKLDFVKDMIAMANAAASARQPAYIVTGVAEDSAGKRVVGISDSPYDDDAGFQDYLKGKITPVPQFVFRTADVDSKKVGVFQVRPVAEGFPYQLSRDMTYPAPGPGRSGKTIYAGQMWTRQGSSQVYLGRDELVGVIESRLDQFWPDNLRLGWAPDLSTERIVHHDSAPSEVEERLHSLTQELESRRRLPSLTRHSLSLAPSLHQLDNPAFMTEADIRAAIMSCKRLLGKGSSKGGALMMAETAPDNLELFARNEGPCSLREAVFSLHVPKGEGVQVVFPRQTIHSASPRETFFHDTDEAWVAERHVGLLRPGQNVALFPTPIGIGVDEGPDGEDLISVSAIVTVVAANLSAMVEKELRILF